MTPAQSTISTEGDFSMLPTRHNRTRTKLCLTASAWALIGAMVPLSAFAQDTQPSEDLSINVVREMEAQHLISRKQGDAIIAKAMADTAKARAAAPRPAPVPAPAPQVAQAPEAPLPEGSVRVPYIPDNVRADIQKQVKDEVVAEEEGSGYVRSVPSWLDRFTPFADFRFRDQANFFDKNNFYGFVDGTTFNAQGPIDINSGSFPIQDSLNNQNLPQIRARFGFNFQVNDEVTTTFMLGSGSDNGPISTIQTLGNDFGKNDIWLDQAYLQWMPKSVPGLTLNFGRFPNPFHSSEILFKQDDFQLDGVAVNYTRDVQTVEGLTAYVTGGAFPIQLSNAEFPTDAPSTVKTADVEQWLFGAQLGGTYTINPRLTENLNAGYYNFYNLQNTPSTCTYTDYYCTSQENYPAYMQKGNTLLYMMPDDTNPTTGASPQYLGLASKFVEVDLFNKLDFAASDTTHIVWMSELTKNVGFNANQIVNNAGGLQNLATNTETCVLPAGVSLSPGESCTAGGGTNVFKSGNTAWMTRLIVGAPVIRERWDWSLAMSYLYIDPDAVVDAFDDKDFRLGGTNSKGYILEGDLGVAHNTWIVAKWLSADAIDGPPFSVDVLQLDLNTRF
jgi:hypothetical protein